MCILPIGLSGYDFLVILLFHFDDLSWWHVKISILSHPFRGFFHDNEVTIGYPWISTIYIYVHYTCPRYIPTIFSLYVGSIFRCLNASTCVAESIYQALEMDGVAVRLLHGILGGKRRIFEGSLGILAKNDAEKICVSCRWNIFDMTYWHMNIHIQYNK